VLPPPPPNPGRFSCCRFFQFSVERPLRRTRLLWDDYLGAREEQLSLPRIGVAGESASKSLSGSDRADEPAGKPSWGRSVVPFYETPSL
jgi:hypothetical protein